MNDDDILNQYSTARPEAPGSLPGVEDTNEDILNLYSKARPEETKPKTESKGGNEFWQGLNDDPSWSALAKRIGISGLRGVKDIVDTGAHGLANTAAYVAEKTLPKELSEPVRKSAENISASDKAAREQYEKEYPASESWIPNATDVGRIGGQIVGTLPIMPTKIIQGVNAAVGALPTVVGGVQKAAPIVNRLVGAAGTGAIGGATLGASTASTNDKSLAENVGEGALTGAIAGPALTGASSAGKALGGKIIGGISHTTADLAKRAEELGIDLKTTQVSGSPLLKKFDQMSGMLPFSGQQGVTEKQIGQFTKAISRTFGMNTNEITPEHIALARKNIGADMEQIYKSSISKVDSQFVNDLMNVVSNAHATMTESEIKPIVNQIKNIAGKINANGELNGDAYHGLTKYDAVLSKAQQSSNPNIRNAANEIRSSMEGLLDRNLPTDQKAALMKARSQYKAAMTVKDLVNQSAEGHISPLRLMQKVVKAPGGKLRSGELGELADIGRKFFPTSSDSGTPLGEKVLGAVTSLMHNPIGAIGAAGAAAAHGAFLADMAAGGFGIAANRLIREGVNSKAVRNALIRSGTGETHGIVNKLTGKVVPYASVPVINKDEKREPLRISIAK